MKWIDIKGPVPSKSGKTNIWHVDTLDGDGLGIIQWFGRWRRYVFVPTYGTVYEEDCLRDIANFCEQVTKEFRESKRGAKGTTASS